MWCNVYSTREVLPVKRRSIFILVKGNINKCVRHSNAANRNRVWQAFDSLSSKFLDECKSEHPYMHNIHLQQLDGISFLGQVLKVLKTEKPCRSCKCSFYSENWVTRRKQLRTLGSTLLPPKAATSPNWRGIWMASCSSRLRWRWSVSPPGPDTWRNKSENTTK